MNNNVDRRGFLFGLFCFSAAGKGLNTQQNDAPIAMWWEFLRLKKAISIIHECGSYAQTYIRLKKELKYSSEQATYIIDLTHYKTNILHPKHFETMRKIVDDMIKENLMQ